MKKVIVVAVLRLVTEQILTVGPKLVTDTMPHALPEWSSSLPLLLIGMLVGRSWLRRMWQ